MAIVRHIILDRRVLRWIVMSQRGRCGLRIGVSGVMLSG